MIQTFTPLSSLLQPTTTFFSHERHFFDPVLASRIGVIEAVLVQHFIFWISLNKRKGINFHDGRTWTYQSLDDIAAHFPYLSRDQVKRIIESKALDLSKKYPVVTITGPRHSGKTTLVQSIFKDHKYHTLENPETRNIIQNDPYGFFYAQK